MKVSVAFLMLAAVAGARQFNGPYEGANLNRIAFPIGGLGSGMYCLEGTGAISAMSVRHKMEFFNEPTCFAAVCVLGEKPEENIARVLEGPIPDWKFFGQAETGNGATGRTYGFPRFRECSFQARFPFATVALHDAALPLTVEITGWSPFTPPDADPSSLPVGMLEYRCKNTSDKLQKAVFSFNTRNFMANKGGSIGPVMGGFVLYAEEGVDREQGGAFAVCVDDGSVQVDHCWFRGGWWDPLTIAWNNVAEGRAVSNPPVPNNAPGASLALPFELKPGEERTIRLHTCWYVPASGLKYGKQPGVTGTAAFRQAPSKGAAAGQQPIKGFLGKGFVNTFDPDGDESSAFLLEDTGGEGTPRILLEVEPGQFKDHRHPVLRGRKALGKGAQVGSGPFGHGQVDVQGGRHHDGSSIVQSGLPVPSLARPGRRHRR